MCFLTQDSSPYSAILYFSNPLKTHKKRCFWDTKKTPSVLGFASKTPIFYHRSKHEKHCFWAVPPIPPLLGNNPRDEGCTRARAYITSSEPHIISPPKKGAQNMTYPKQQKRTMSGLEQNGAKWPKTEQKWWMKWHQNVLRKWPVTKPVIMRKPALNKKKRPKRCSY